MSIRFNCNCGTTMEVPDELAGRRGKCPKCNSVVTVPLKATQAVSNNTITHEDTLPQDAKSIAKKTTNPQVNPQRRMSSNEASIIRMKCECDNDIFAKRQFEGRKIKCKKCGKILTIMANDQKDSTVSKQIKETAKSTKPDNIFSNQLPSQNTSNSLISVSDNSQPVLIPVSSVGEPHVSATTDNPKTLKDNPVSFIQNIIIKPGVVKLCTVRLCLALGLIVSVCLIQFSGAMRLGLLLKLFSILLFALGLATITIGGISRSVKDIVLGAIALVATLNTSFFINIFKLQRVGYYTPSHLEGAKNMAFRVLLGFAGMCFILVSGFAILAVISNLLAMKQKHKS